MAGAVQRALAERHQDLVEELRELADWSQAPFGSSSGFAFAFDPDADPHAIDASAVAQELGVFLRAAIERPVRPRPTVTVPNGTGAPLDRPGATDNTSVSPSAPPLEADPEPQDPASGAPAHESDPVGSTVVRSRRRIRPRRTPPPHPEDRPGPPPTPFPPGARPPREPTPATPATPARAEQAATGDAPEASLDPDVQEPDRDPDAQPIDDEEQACEALDHGWWPEAEALFLACAEAAPTEPFPWFGAGLAASHLDADRAADHFEKAARYLIPHDQPGAVYTTLLAAAHREAIDDRPGAIRLLRQQAEELSTACPTLALHLARIDTDPERWVDEALSRDPLLEPDLLALGLATPERIDERRRLVEDAVRRLESSIDELRQVDGGPAWTDDRPITALSPLSLVEQEMALWRTVRACEAELARAQELVAGQERARQAKQDEVDRQDEIAGTDLTHLTALPFFITALAIAVAMGTVLVIGVLLSARAQGSGAVLALTWLFEAILVGLGVQQFLRAWLPHRHYPLARQAVDHLKQLEWEVSELRQSEFEVRRRFRRASQNTEIRLDRIRDRRSFLVPTRPTFT